MRLRLRASIDRARDDADAQEALLRRATFGGLRLLYAEDNEVDMELRGLLLARPAVELRTAASGTQAILMARADPPELMLVDMYLGDMTGLELAQALHADPRTQGIRLVALSADTVPAHIQTALDRGFEAYVTKPVDFKRLLRLLDDAAGVA